MFADDTKIFHFVGSKAVMQHLKMIYINFINGHFIGDWGLTSPSVNMYTLDQNISLGQYYLNGIMIDSVESQTHLGNLFDHQLEFH